MDVRGMKRLRRLRRMPLMSVRQWTRRLVFWLGAVVVGLAAISFAALADRASDLFLAMVAGRPWLPFLLAPVGLGFCLFLTRTLFPGAQGSGIPQVIAALHMSSPERIGAMLSLRIAVGKVVLTLVGLACGASIGREGPTVQVSATIMHALGRVLRLPRADAQRALVLAGGAAGVAAAFNTPLAGLVFAIEELSHSFEARTSGTVLTAVIVAGHHDNGAAGQLHLFRHHLGAARFRHRLGGSAGLRGQRRVGGRVVQRLAAAFCAGVAGDAGAMDRAASRPVRRGLRVADRRHRVGWKRQYLRYRLCAGA